MKKFKIWIYSSGPKVAEFEEAFASYVEQTRNCCYSGTTALHLALLAVGAVMCYNPSFQLRTTGNCALYVGKTSFVDIDPKTYNH